LCEVILYSKTYHRNSCQTSRVDIGVLFLYTASEVGNYQRGCLLKPKTYDDDVSTIPPNPVCDACGLGLCQLSALVCDLLSRMGVYPVIRWKVGPHRSGALY